ncbi:MAG: MBOAT family protein [Oscillospiraceae bacterium]|jgi:alginate O-acetyltransferase complex protein AlgI|nr:MBOAT family protein [Oscillospiraceae bacterium]
MLFSSIPFLFYFLPVFFVLYFTMPIKARNVVLLLASLIFYYYGERGYVLLLVFSSVMDYTISLIVEKYRGKPAAKAALLVSVIGNLLILGFFKYSDFFIGNINAVFGTSLPLLHIHLPLGISFYTFQTMSYTIDVYRGQARPQKNPFDFAAYVTMFPQLVAGPIVRYQTVADQLTSRKHTWEGFAYGATRFIIGLGKKVLIANTLGELNQAALASGNKSVLFYWLAVVAFMLQIYFDFSGYSDMAIGLGRIIGFRFLENFNYPFIARSVSEFWQRWHISMGTWFREYIYIPLGGNRVSKLKWVRNIAVVWFVTGLWHGAAWNFIIWGLYFGVILTLEKLFLSNWLKKIPRITQHLYVMVIVIFSFVIFHLESVAGITEYLKGMVGLMDVPAVNSESAYYLRSYGFVLILAVFGATPVLKNLVNRAKLNPKLQPVAEALTPVFNIVLLLIITAYLVDSSFNPFLYFRF